MTAINKVSATLRAAVIDYTRANDERDFYAQGATAKFADVLMAEGVTLDMLKAPAKGEDRTFYDGMLSAIVGGWHPWVQKMITSGRAALPETAAAPTKSKVDKDGALSAAQKRRAMEDAKVWPSKPNCAYWQQQKGSAMKDVRKALERRLAADAAAAAADAGEDDEASEGKGKASATWEAKVRATLTTMVKQAQSKEGSTVKDMPAFIRDLNSAIARIPA